MHGTALPDGTWNATVATKYWMQIYRTLIAATTTAMVAYAAHAQQPLLTRVDRAGTGIIRQADGTPPIVNITVGLYETGWQLRSATPGKDAGKVRITCPTAGAIVEGDISFKVSEADPETLVITANLLDSRSWQDFILIALKAISLIKITKDKKMIDFL